MMLIMGGLVFFMSRSQKKRAQQTESFQRSLDVGDEVVTAGGVHGLVNALEEDLVHLLVDTDVVIRVSRTAISRYAKPEAATEDAGGSGSAVKS